jgi:DsbC/DsbD-like thiol-disulfide interchange protein
LGKTAGLFSRNQKTDTRMKQLILLLVTLAAFYTANAQKVNWRFTSKKLAPGKYELHLTANLPSGWHIYSQASHTDGPTPTQFTFNNNPLFTAEGKIREVGKMKNYFDSNFKVDVKYFPDRVDFVRVVKLKTKIKTNVSGQVESSICNNRVCMPTSTMKFNIALK